MIALEREREREEREIGMVGGTIILSAEEIQRILKAVEEKAYREFLVAQVELRGEELEIGVIPAGRTGRIAVIAKPSNEWRGGAMRVEEEKFLEALRENWKRPNLHLEKRRRCGREAWQVSDPRGKKWEVNPQVSSLWPHLFRATGNENLSSPRVIYDWREPEKIRSELKIIGGLFAAIAAATGQEVEIRFSCL